MTCSAIFVLLSPSTAGASPGKPLIFIDPGHGGLNIGAIDPLDRERPEKIHTLRYGRALRDRLLASRRVRVQLTRQRDRFLNLEDRLQQANRRGAALFVSVHLNASEPAGAVGHGTFFLSTEVWRRSERKLEDFSRANRRVLGSVTRRPPRAKVARSVLLGLLHQRAVEGARRLAIAVNEGMQRESRFGSRGVKQANFGVLRGAAIPAIVCEVGFINHPEEGPFITSDAGRAALVDGITEGILTYLDQRPERGPFWANDERAPSPAGQRSNRRRRGRQ
ncbi:MAG: N-acetylmuramoyl-L-alanine amidase [Myxococcota bacterium]|nr:N-acetylmuramoyl-L-alanine amidase [Myxococcota bacterium]